ncbi:MAG: EAL domain-containing protein [Candidatus Dormibacteraeota bacterium]|uniref:EAL domain-containing protein n=1 Tax=Candidatus Amunia macphersoniae TaxID=3127014 RepID=A0A934NIU5_9BACT|nr:EAL domain-containing protein [Candidatus Dormibacteraeota bacterium]
MRNRPSELRLGVLTELGRRLPNIRNPDEAALEVTRALAPLTVAAAVVAVQGDTAVVVAVNVPSGVPARLTPALAGHLVGVRVPVDAIEALRQPVRLQRAFCGVAGAAETLRRLAGDSAMAHALPAAGEEAAVVAVPVVARDRVVAVLAIWGAGRTDDLVPTLEAAAAMLAASWQTDEPAVERFPILITPSARSDELRAAVESLLTEERIVAAVQPIARLYDGSVIGYEALARFSPLELVAAPDELFAAAALLHMQADVDLACMRGALSEAPNIGDADLFINVLIGTLLDRRGMAALDAAVHDAGVDPGSIVLEFSEREPVSDLARLQRIAAELRARGFRIAVDDAGAGHASMRVIAELRPEFIKVDRSLIHAVETDQARRALVMALLSFSGHIGARLIAEGIETRPEIDVLASLGVQFGQGWLLGRPVLTQPIDGQRGVEVVDAGWFARRPVSNPRVAPAQAVQAAMPASRTTAVPAAAASRAAARAGLPRALSDAATALQSEHDPMRILGVMSELLSRVVPVTEMAIFMAEYETHRLVPVIATGPDRNELLADSFSMDAGLTGLAFAQGIPQNIPDTSTHPLARQVPGTPVVRESLLLIPLVAGEHKLGIINCWRLGVGRFTERELEAASLFAHVAAAAWRNAQLYAELLSAVMTDPLTRLYNSRWLRDTGERDMTRAARDGRPLALLLVDLDHFKTVNDHGGHAAGDLVLQRVATRLRTIVRGADALVRLGGEEFVALLHDCDAEGAAIVAEGMRVAVRELTLPAECGLTRLTASIGIAAYPDHGRDLDQLLAAADRAMYTAKHGGRDRVSRAPCATEAGTIVALPPRSRAVQSRRIAPAAD